MKYYVYQLIDPTSNKPFYVGKGSGNRAYTHNKFKDGNNNPYKDRYIKKLHQQGLEPIVDIVKYFDDETTAYEYEDQLTESIGLKNLTNIAIGARPPSRSGWTPTAETLARRSRGLKGVVRTEEWCKKLSSSKKGKNNPMYGKKNPCSDQRRFEILKAKNEPHYNIYKEAILMMNSGLSADKVAVLLNIGRGVCFKLKNRTHGIFQAFPELM